MERKNTFLITILVVSVLVVGEILMQQGTESPNNINSTNTGSESITSSNNTEEVKLTSEGTKYTVYPDELIQGCPGMDCIPSIEDPEYEEGSEVEWLNTDDRIIGLEINGDVRAYPVKILSSHEIVNDEVGGEPVAVTYCPLCRSGVTYSRKINGEVLEFGVSGKLHDANLVMFDRKSETYWNQISGKAIVGEKVPQELELLFSSITTWEEWVKSHPGTKVLSRNTGIYPAITYESEAYQGYKNSQNVGYGVGEVDDRLTSKEPVYVINIENISKAYTDEAVKQENLIEDKIKNKTVLVFQKPGDGTVNAIVKDDKGLKFNLMEENLVDSNGDTWNFEGKQMSGNGSMRKVIPQGFYWFAWSKFNPETQVYKPDNQK